MPCVRKINQDGVDCKRFFHRCNTSTFHFPILDTLHTVYGDIRPSEASEKLQRWLLLLPNIIRAQIEAALRQERPFLPPYITPEMMAAKNNIVPSMTQMDILYVSKAHYRLKTL